VVKGKRLAVTFTDAVSGRKKYQVQGGTILDILDDRGNDLFYHKDKSKGRVEVAIIIPADWDERPGHEGELRPDKPCSLKTSGDNPPIVSLSCQLASPALAGPAIPDLTGQWKPLNSDNRVMTMKSLKDKITIDAPDLSCTITELQSEENDPHSVTGNSLCHDESETSYSKETFSLLRAGSQVLLIDATVLLRLVNEYSEPKIDEAYTNKPAIITVYRKVR
jgi:hypothetical protein